MKYKVGDKVIVTDNNYHNESGEIINIDKRDSSLPYEVLMYSNNITRWFHQYEVSPQLPFPIGTRVKCYTEVIEPFTGIFQGQSESKSVCWAIELDDNTKGGAQNGWWNWEKSFKMEAVKDTTVDLIKGYFGGSFTYTNGDYFNKLIVFDGSICSEFIKTYNHKYMSIKNKIKMLMTGEPEKTLIKHGILTIDKELTSEGKQLFNDFIEKKFKDEFLKELYEVLKDEKVEV